MLHERQAIEVQREDLATVRTVIDDEPRLDDGQARLRIEAFALTANNVTYAVVGGPMQYWDFFPALDEQWGRVPVWGYGQVVESHSDAVVIGERVYGYFPMASELVVTPGRADRTGFADLAPHRRPMASAYNRYQRVGDIADPVAEALQMVLYPLFVTSFLIADAIVDEPSGAGARVVVSSASSKTAIALAHAARHEALEIIGLTSPRHRRAVEELAIYDAVWSYDEIDRLADDDGPWVYVDIAGDGAITARVHTVLGTSLVRSIGVGITHWDQPRGDQAIPGVAPEFFFAPTRITKRAEDWGRDGYEARVRSAWDDFVGWAANRIRIEHLHGANAVTTRWLELLAGSGDPNVGTICSLAPTS